MVVFVWFCMKYIWPPILDALEERQKQIEEGLAAADRSQEALAAAEAKAEEIIGEARQQATGILDQAHSRANEIVADGKDGRRQGARASARRGESRDRAGNQQGARRTAWPGFRDRDRRRREDPQARDRRQGARRHPGQARAGDLGCGRQQHRREALRPGDRSRSPRSMAYWPSCPSRWAPRSCCSKTGRSPSFSATPTMSTMSSASSSCRACLRRRSAKAPCFAGGNAHGTNFLKLLLLENGRVVALPEIARQLRGAQGEDREHASTPSSPRLRRSARSSSRPWRTRSRQALGRDVNVTTEIDENLIGGAVIRAGDVVIDGSLRARLEGLANALTK